MPLRKEIKLSILFVVFLFLATKWILVAQCVVLSDLIIKFKKRIIAMVFAMVSAYHYTLQFHILYCKGEHATSIVISYSNYFCSGLYGPIYLYFSGVQPAFGFGILGIWLYENLVDRLCICLHQDPFCQFYSYNLVSL